MYNVIIIRYSEIFLKSEYVKKEFENRLIDNIRLKLGGTDGKIKIIKGRHRIYIKTDDAETLAEKIRQIFGIKSLSPAIETASDMENISDCVIKLAKKVIKKGNSFAVRVKRSKDYKLKSKDVEERLGSLILDRMECYVDLNNPDKKIFVEIYGNKAYIFHKKINGFGGLPYKTQGKLIALISGGIDSPVAAWMMMRRGCEIIALHFGENGKDIKRIVKVLEDFSVHGIEIILIPYEKILSKIYKNADKYTCIICKRIMYRVAERIAENKNALGIITGENVGQVASQTLYNLKILDSAINIPVYRPLVGMDKEDIVKIAKNISTYGIAEDKKCRFAPKKPATKADMEKIERIEKNMGVGKLIDILMDNHRNG
ncbi:MAG: tRNA 4-thiouridine(8) synthase ThiI [Candidatus Altiarchaeales archaeon]|nr:MAG: tRNA 4-thiouridine(8) synthase ThiI [Candidatus Altiarchaeales archaeon]